MSFLKKKREKTFERRLFEYLSFQGRGRDWGGFLSREQEKREGPGNEVIWHCFHFRFSTQFGISGLI